MIGAAVILGIYATQRDLPLIQGLSNWVAEQANVVAALTKPAGDTKYGHQPAGRIPTNQQKATPTTPTPGLAMNFSRRYRGSDPASR